jgi:hypothetical protein
LVLHESVASRHQALGAMMALVWLVLVLSARRTVLTLVGLRSG